MKAPTKINWPKALGIGITVLLSGGFMLYLRFSGITLFDLPHEISYQLLTLALTGIVVLISRLLAGHESLQYLKPASLDGPITPVRWLGINPKPGVTWVKLGINFLIVITFVTAVVIYFQVFRRQEVNFSVTGVLLPAIGFAVINALAEEGIFRFSIVSVFLSAGVPAGTAAITSGVIFGGLHYFGTPGGIPGVLMAGFIGWFLAKSIIETRSFAWAWIIHAAQDVVIFTALFATT